MTGCGRSPAWTLRLAFAVISAIVMLAGCSALGPASPSALPTPAVRPDVPNGWRTVTSDEGDVRLVVPPDVEVVLTAGGVLGQVTMQAGRIPFEVWATAPAGITQPAVGQPMLQWLEQSGWMPREGDGFVRGPTTERETLLPAGQAYEVRTSVQPGTPDEGSAVLYVVATDRGRAIIRFVGTAEGLEQRAGDIELISRLVEFGD